jgi:hypothetical protein
VHEYLPRNICTSCQRWVRTRSLTHSLTHVTHSPRAVHNILFRVCIDSGLIPRASVCHDDLILSSVRMRWSRQDRAGQVGFHLHKLLDLTGCEWMTGLLFEALKWLNRSIVFGDYESILPRDGWLHYATASTWVWGDWWHEYQGWWHRWNGVSGRSCAVVCWILVTADAMYFLWLMIL